MMKEQIALDVMEMTDAEALTHDDRLSVTMPKRLEAMADGGGNKLKGLGIAEGWQWMPGVQVQENGRTVYWNGIKGDGSEYIGKSEYDKLKDRTGWIEVRDRELFLADRVQAVFKDSRIELRLTNLFYKVMESRYTMALDHLADMVGRGLLKYESRKDDPTEKNIRDAVRMRAKRATQWITYEHDTLIPGRVIRPIIQELKAQSKDVKGDGGNVTIYMSAERYKGQTKSIKIYSPTMRSGLGNDDLYKIETTFLPAYFTNAKIKVDGLLTQPEIQARLEDDIAQGIALTLAGLSEGALEMLATEYRVETKDRRKIRQEIARKMIGRTLADEVADLKRRMDAVEREQEATRKRLEKAGL